MASKKQLSADAPAFAPVSTPPNNDETIPVAPAAVEDQRAVVADKLRRLQHAQRAQLKAMLPKLPEGPAKLQLKKKIWAIEKELFPKEAAAPPPRRAIESACEQSFGQSNCFLGVRRPPVARPRPEGGVGSSRTKGNFRSTSPRSAGRQRRRHASCPPNPAGDSAASQLRRAHRQQGNRPAGFAPTAARAQAQREVSHPNRAAPHAATRDAPRTTMGGGGSKTAPEGENEEDELPRETEDDKKDPNNKPLDVGKDFGGPCKKRKCTDVLCTLLLAFAWFCMTVVGLACIPGSPIEGTMGLQKGNPYKLINGIDYKDRVCGIDSDVKDRLKLYYLPTGSGVCIKKCPEKQNAQAFHCTDDAQEKLDKIDRTQTGWEVLYVAKGFEMVKECNDPKCSDPQSLRRCQCCAPYYPTNDVMNYCVSEQAQAVAAAAGDQAAQQAADATKPCDPTPPPVAGATKAPTPLCGAALAAESQERDYTEKMYADMMVSMWYIFGFGFFGAIFVGFVYTFILRIPGVLALVVWGIIVAVGVFWLALAAMCYQTSVAWKQDEDRDANQANGMLYLAYFCAALCALWACTICCLRKRIALAIGITKEAAKCIATMPIIIVFPVVQVMALIVFVIPWFIYCLFLASSGEMETVKGARQMVYDETTFKAGWYMIFVYFWSSEFIIALGQIILALAVSTWYFTRDKGKIGNSTVIWSFRQGAWYHWGTAAFGSLIIAIIKTIRAMIKYIQKKCKNIKNPVAKKIAMAVLCCIDCCMWCIEKCMKFINKNAYIQTAIFGYHFCKAAKCAFFLILRNIARIMALSIVSGFVLLLGKLVITAGATFLCYVCLAYTPVSDELNYIWLPLVFTAIIAFYVAAMFNEVWGMAMSTILQCFCADEEIYKGDKDAMYAGSDLKATVSNSNKGKFAKKSKVAAAPAEDEGDAVI